MDISDILSQVESPFTDEKIENLINTFIECNFDNNEVYKRINYLNLEKQENPHLNELYSRLFSISNREERFVDENISWTKVASGKDVLSVPYEYEDRIPIYRIYLNAKGKDKAKIIEEYVRNCEESKHDYKFKYSIRDGRQDEILILSYGKDLARNIELIEKITEGMDLGKPADLLGKYKDKIGIGEEYIEQPIFSYTQTRLGIIPIVMQKYILDHISEFESYLNDGAKKTANYLLESFKEESEYLSKRINRLKKDDRRIEKLKRKQYAYQNNMDLDFLTMDASICKSLPEVIRTFIKANYETAIPEIIDSYRMACEMFGISRNGVFSKETEKIMEEEKQTPLQKREEELSALEKEAKLYDQLEEIKDKIEQKYVKDVGE